MLRALSCVAVLTSIALAAVPRAAGAQSWLPSAAPNLGPLSRSPGYVPGRLLVKFKEGTPRAAIERVVHSERASLLGEPQSDGLFTVELGPGDAVERVLDRWNALPDVEYAAADLYVSAFFTPNDSTIAAGNLAWNLRSVDAFSAWDVVTGDPGVVLAIVDTGVAFEDYPIPDYERNEVKAGVTMYRQSPELPGPFRPGYDFVHEDAHPNDDYGHGTHVATVAAGLANNVAGSAGIAFGVTILPVKVLDHRGGGQISGVIRGIRFATDHGANVMNLSLGVTLHDKPNILVHSLKPLRDAIRYAQRRGVIVVAASGNKFDGRYSPCDEVSAPASFPGVIAVGGTDPDGRRSDFGCFGKELDFVAPGGRFFAPPPSTVLDPVAIWNLGIKPWRSDPTDREEGSLANPDSFNVFGHFGTSFASPHVAGAVALLLSMGVTSQGAIEQALRATAIHPFGNPNARDREYGFGLIQVGAAVRYAARAHAGKPTDQPGRSLGVRLLSGNPARGSASVSFRTTSTGSVLARVFDARGAVVRTVAADRSPAGERIIRWDGRDERGAPVPSGIYFLHVETPDGAAVRKIAFLR